MSDAPFPLSAAQWQAHADAAGLADKLANLAETGASLHQIVQAVPDTLEELARWAQAWGALAVEVAKWYAVANAFPNYRQAVMQYLYLLMRFGSYPATIRPPAIDPELGDGKLLSPHRLQRMGGGGTTRPAARYLRGSAGA